MAKQRKQYERIDRNDQVTHGKQISIDVEGPGGHTLADSIEAPEYDKSTEHPSPEQLLLREAVKVLTPKQRKIWDMWNYDRLSQYDIAEKMGIARQTVDEHIKAAEKRMAVWCRANMGTYELLKTDYEKLD